MFSSDKWFGASADFYNGVATQSLRMDYASGVYLNFTPTSTGDRKTWTWSGWIKRTEITRNNQYIYSAHSGSNYFAFYFKQGQLASYYGTGSNYGVISDREFRDTTNWFHIVHQVDAVNTNQRVWVNGDEITTNSSRNPGNSNYPMNQSSVPMVIGKHSWGSSYFNDMYLAEVNFTDGQKYEASDFGETKNGVWIAKEPSVTYGTNGYRLQFKQTGDGQTTASSTTIGADTSGNNNHYKDYNLDSYDSNMPDSPENNFATFNVLTGHTATTMSEGNLRGKGANSGNILESQSSTIGVTSGKWYAEFRADDLVNDTQNNGTQIGVTTVPYIRGSGNQNGYIVGNTRVNLDQSSGAYLGVDQNISTTIGSYADGDIIGVALNVDDSEVSFYKNGSAITNATDASINPQNDLHFFEIQLRKYDGDTSQVTANFGQDSTFSGAVSAGGNTDSRGRGDFKYSVPSGYLALCTANLPDLTISPNQQTQADDHFNTITYTGDDASSRSLTGVGFQPDWIWYKHRSISYGHAMYDSSRGTGENHLRPDNTIAEGDYNDLYGTLTSFDADGITIARGDASGTESAFFNTNGATVVGWNWKANGGTTTSFSEVGSNPAGTHQANTTAGFSIVTYTGTGSSGTVSHGLGAVPAMYLVKNRDVNTHNWLMWHQDLATNGFIALNLSQQAYYDSARFTSNNPTSSVFYVGTDASTNADGENFVAYVFAEVEGYSKFGSYTGSGDTDGTFVYTGFRPAWVMIKRTNGTGQWFIMDNKRDGYNGVNYRLLADASNTEYTGSSSNIIDILSNGFKCKVVSNNHNGTGLPYIYMAFAEQPFKFSNAR